MQLAMEIINPAFAKQALEQNAGNRRISQTRVELYARDMKQGNWHENNGETLKFTSDGKLLDGQHRLLAIVLSQCTVCMAVARNVPASAFVTIDSGKSRSLADVLSIEGYKHTGTLGGMSRATLNYLSGVSFSYQPTRSALEQFITVHPYLAEVSSIVGNKLRVFPKMPVAIVYYLATHAGKYEKEAKEFIDALDTGQGLFKGDPRLTVREWYINNRGKKQGQAVSSELMTFGVARAWNAYAEGRTYEKMAFARGTSFNRKYVPIVGHDRNLFKDIPLIGDK